MDLHADHAQCLSAGVNVVQSRLNSLHVTAELLIDALVALVNCFVRVLDTAAANTGQPCPHKSTKLSPTVHALTVARDL